MRHEAVLERCASVVSGGRRADRDLDLLDALRSGDSTATDGLVTTYGQRAYRLAAAITGNEQDAEEVVQDAFWSAIRKIDTFRGESAFGSWLYRIVANAAYQKVRSRRAQRREVPLEDLLPTFDEQGRHVAPTDDWSARVDDPSLQTDLRLALTSAMDALPAASRTMLVLRDVEGLSNVEVAAMLGVSEPVVKTRVHRARLFLRRRLDEFMATSNDMPVGSAA